MNIFKKVSLFFVVLFFLCSLQLITGSFVFAEDKFSTDFDVTYTVKESGITEIKNRIILTNTYSNFYATAYSIILESINPTNIKVYSESGTPYQTKTIKDGDKTIIDISFPDVVVGKDKSRIFYISFDEQSFAIKTGEIWEVSIPRLADNATFGNYVVHLVVPERFGQEAYISPSPRERVESNNNFIYRFNKEDVEKTGIVAGFGDFQVFNFALNYHLENPLAKNAETEIALPPDTAFQKMYYSDINPRPTSMKIDEDGNWIAKYNLKPRERIDVVATGNVQIFAGLRPYLKSSEETLSKNLQKSDFWETDDPQIIELAQELKTPRRIYDYVSKTLTYDYSRVKTNVERLGAINVLNNPNSAICMEFTDLFIALARSAGIPAREINGYAYTENPQIQPLSLVNDVLHSWPEYYDRDKGAWIPVDPTWASTTGGVDYFSKLDLRHFTFVIHGNNSRTPYAAGSYKLGSNPQKDVYVSFGSLPKDRNSNLKIDAKIASWIPLVSNSLNLRILNNGPIAVYNVLPNIYFDDLNQNYSKVIDNLLPFQEVKTVYDIPFSFLGSKTPTVIKVVVNDNEVKLPTNKNQVVIYNMLFIFVISLIILIYLVIKLKWRYPKKTS